MILRPILPGITDHGVLNGLGDDDHSHYHNDARGDARYFREDEHLDTSAGAGDAGKPIKLDAAGHVDESMLNDADVDHGSVDGLGDDDHVDYLRIDTSRGLTGQKVYVGNSAEGAAYFEFVAGVLRLVVKGTVEQEW